MIRIQHLYKSYHHASQSRLVLNDINFQLEQGEIMALMGQSGAGKSTLLNIIGMLDDYDSGDYYLNDVHIKNMPMHKLSKYRSQLIGFVFQQFHLIPSKTALENVVLPLYYQGVSHAARYKQALSMLDRVGLVEYAGHKPDHLSGGQQQRVAIARALVTTPPLILADEPTGSLDTQTAYEIMALLKEMNREGNTILIVTHSSQVARQCDVIQEIVAGKILE